MLQDAISEIYGLPRLCKVIPDDVQDCINVSGLSLVGWFSSQAMIKLARAVPN